MPDRSTVAAHYVEPPLPCSRWLACLEQNQDGWPALRADYGNYSPLVREKIRLIRETVEHFLRVFGDLPVRLYRAPGRINLRGMHIDTHGGWLNLQPHHRETLAAVAVTADNERHYINLNPSDPDFTVSLKPFCDLLEAARRQHARHDPDALTNAVMRRRAAELPEWGRYVLGAALAARFHGAPSPEGLRMVIASDMIRGASLSSSASLCVAVLMAEWGVAGTVPDPASLLYAARQAEWFAGARVGLSDQCAVALGRGGAVLHTALGGADLFREPPRWHPMPEDAVVLVIHTFTMRSLSGTRRVEYARNRFAYSVALRMLEAAASDWGSRRSSSRAARFHTFPEVLNAFPDNQDRLNLIRTLPETLDLIELERICGTETVRTEYDRLFGDLPEPERLTRFEIRGPILFGLAETLRARRFFEAIEAGDFVRAGQLMRIGHDGDRVTDAAGRPFRAPADEKAMRQWLTSNQPLEMCPGWYGASTPALDQAVDIALAAGALGACLTGAGLGGAVLALCRKSEAEAIRAQILDRLASEDFQRTRGLDAPPWSSDVGQTAVEENLNVAGAGILPPPPGV